MHRHPTKRLLLFLAVLALPTLAIVVQGVMIASRDRQLAQSRANERMQETRRRLAAEVGQNMFALLERIKGEEVASASGIIPLPGSYSSDAVVLVSRINGRSLLWPWNRASMADAHRARMKDAPFAQHAAEARQAEAQQDYRQAADLYQKLISLPVLTDGQLAYARLGYARALRLSGALSDAVAMYRTVLRTKSTVVDEDDLSFASLAAAELVGMKEKADEVLARLQDQLGSRDAMAPVQTAQWQRILETLRTNHPQLDQRAAELAGQMATQVRQLNVLKSRPEIPELERQFPTMQLTPDTWRPFRPRGRARSGELWLVGRAAASSFLMQPVPSWRLRMEGPAIAPSMDAFLPLVVVVRIESIRAQLEERLSGKEAGQLRIDTDITGEPLDETHLPGLKVTFPDLEAKVAASLGLPRSFYGWSLLIVVPLTFLGGYLFWRDTRREVRMAALRSQFVSSVSHELKTPLTAIRMFAEALHMKYAPDARLQQEYLDTIVKESERLTRLLDNVLDYSRIDHGQKRYRMQPLQLADVVRSAARTMQYPLQQQGFFLDLRIEDGLPDVNADRDALHQALLNLLTNAMKYSGESRWIGLQLERDADGAVIRVIDRGIGIPPAEQRRIFDAFYRPPIPENVSIAGTGLGLAIVAHTAAAHGGRVQVHSVPGAGSTLSFHLPLAAGTGP